METLITAVSCAIALAASIIVSLAWAKWVDSKTSDPIGDEYDDYLFESEQTGKGED